MDDVNLNCSGRFYVLRIVKPLVDKKALISVYYALIRSVIEYAAPAICCLSFKHLLLIKRIQRRSHNIICYQNCNCDILPDLQTRRKIIVSKFLSKIKKKLITHCITLFH